MKRIKSKFQSGKLAALLVATGAGLLSTGTAVVGQDTVSDQQVPAVILRPSSRQIADCEVELDRPDGSPGFRLKINVPDAVSTIEVSPMAGSGRSFRIRMDDAAALKAAAVSNTSQVSGLPSNNGANLRSPMAVMAKTNWQSANHPSSNSEATTLSANQPDVDASTVLQTAGGFVENPFFANKAKHIKKSLETLAKKPRKKITRVAKQDPVTLDEISNIKMVSLESGNEQSVATIESTVTEPQANSNVGSIAVNAETIRALSSKAEIAVETPPTAENETSQAGFTETEIARSNFDFGSLDQFKVPNSTDSTEALPETTEPQPKAQFELPVRLTVSGPGNIAVGATGDYTITVKNNSLIGIGDLKLTLDTPASLEVLVIEQAADFDEKNGKLTWSLPRIEAGSQMEIRYRIGSVSTGQFEQKAFLQQGTNVSAAIEKIFATSSD